MEGVIDSHAPARICDLGGWTDTWFSRHGRVLSIAVRPGAGCRVSFTSGRSVRKRAVTLDVRDFGDRYSFDPGDPPMDRHPLLEATVAAMDIPSGLAVEVSLWSGMPPGCGTGTSAAVEVALIGALDRLTPGTLGRDEVWRLAHRVETGPAGLESGIQDQICAAYGGICFIEIDEYPDACVRTLALEDDTISELESRLVLVFLGKGHDSSAVHSDVIDRLSGEGAGSSDLERLRAIPLAAKAALENGDLAAYGRLMVENTEAQRSLHPSLVSPVADRVISAVTEAGAAGWKLNGAGGSGGTVTILAGEGDGAAGKLVETVDSLGGGVRAIPVSIDREGLRVTSGDRRPA